MVHRVSIVILNWNGWEDTIECLESLYQISYPTYDVIVVDNGSADESIQKIRDYCESKIKVKSEFFEYDPDNKPINHIEYTKAEVEVGKEHEIADLPSNRKLILLKNEKNYGFAGGANIGMMYALKVLKPDYVLLLNNDTSVDQEFLSELIKVAESDEKIGFVGCKSFYPNGEIQDTGAFIKPYNLFGVGVKNKVSNNIKAVDYISGAALLIKSEVIDEVGLLDEKFFPAYFEESDWSIRAKRNGYKCIYNPKATLIHRVSATAKKLKPDWLYYVWEKNRLRFMLLNFPRSWLVIRIPIEIAPLILSILKLKTHLLLMAYWINFKDRAEILEKRRKR